MVRVRFSLIKQAHSQQLKLWSAHIQSWYAILAMRAIEIHIHSHMLG